MGKQRDKNIYCAFSIDIKTKSLKTAVILIFNKIINNSEHLKTKIDEIIFSFSRFRTKDLSFCHKPGFSNPNIFAIKCRRPLIFQNMNSFRSHNNSLKYWRFTPPGCKDKGIRKSEFVAFQTFSWHLSCSMSSKKFYL